MDERFNTNQLYNIYCCTICVREKLCGGMPRNPDLIRTWVESTTKFKDEQTEEQAKEALDALAEEEAEKSWIGFPSDGDGLFIWARHIKAMFKECASMLRITTKKIGSKQILQHGFEIKAVDGGNRVHLDRPEPDGFDEGPIHVQTAQGPRTALKRVDFVAGPLNIVFDVWVLATAPAEKRHVGEKEIVKMLTFAQENGLGADRSQGRGKFDVVGFEQTWAPPKEKVKKAAKPKVA